MFHRVKTLAICVLFLAVASSARADVWATYGFTPRGIAMGNAFSAGVDDFSASYYNPAGMAWLTKPSFGAGYLFAGNRMKTLYAENTTLDRMQGLLFGASIPLPFQKFLERRLAFGFSCFFPNGTVLAMKVAYPTQPQYLLLQNAGRSLSLAPTLSLRIIDGLSVGGGAQLFDNTSGRIDATIDPNGQIEATVGEELTTFFAPIAGVMVLPGEWSNTLSGFRFGAVFHDKFYTKYRIPVNTFIGGVPLRVDFTATSLFIPRQYTAGVGYGKPGSYLFEVDGSYNEWSEYPDPNLNISVNFQIPILPVKFIESMSRPPNFHDTVSVKSGGEVKFFDNNHLQLWARAGYGYEPSPVPAQTHETNYLDSDRHIASVGFGTQVTQIGSYKVDIPFSIDLVAQYQRVQRRIFEKSSTVDATNPGYPKIGVEGDLWAFGISYSTRFDYRQ